MINKISGKWSLTEIKHLQDCNKEITTPTDIADTLAESFWEISSTVNYTTKFHTFKAYTEHQLLKCSSNNMEAYNIPFSTPIQSGFRKGQSTTDQLVCFHKGGLRAEATCYCYFL